MDGAAAARNTFLGASYNFGMIRTFLEYETNRGAGGSPGAGDKKFDDAMIGFSVPFGVSQIGASYIHVHDYTAIHDSAQQIAISDQYYLSARTNLYASCTPISNKNTLFYTTAEADGNSEFNIGIRH